MSKTTEEFEKIMEADRGERAYYAGADPSDAIRFPITRDGFEALVERACSHMDIPVTDPLRNVLVGFVHHVENDTCTTTIEKVGATLFKSMANHLTWKLDQEIKEKANKELRVEQEKQQAAKEAMEKEKKIAAAQEKRKAKSVKKGMASADVANHNANEETV